MKQKQAFGKTKASQIFVIFTKLDSEKETADEKFEKLMKHLGK